MSVNYKFLCVFRFSTFALSLIWHTCDRTLDGPSPISSRVFSFFLFLVKLRFCFFTVDFKEVVRSLNILLATNDSKKRCIWIDEVLIIEILKNAVCPTVGGGGCCQIVMAECWWMCVWASHFDMVSVIKFTFLENFWRTIGKVRSQALGWMNIIWSSDTQQSQWHTHAKLKSESRLLSFSMNSILHENLFFSCWLLIFMVAFN